MKNEEIASCVSRLVYYPQNRDEEAVKVIVERLLIPNDIGNYTEEDVRRNVLWHLNTQDELNEMND